MVPSKRDVESMVGALFTMNAGLERARRQRKGASTLSLLQVIADHEGIRPSEIADLQQVHPSLVTRQIQELEDAGYVKVAKDPADRRSLQVTLTEAGCEELRRLVDFGLKRFALFVKGWRTEDVRRLTDLLWKLQTSMATVSAREQLPGTGRRRAQGSRLDR
ncbi:MAG: MarR family transcriptional regulator [Acidimicrobiales bacterium]|jgi:DNA-binding MarR family transcriptional regulator